MAAGQSPGDGRDTGRTYPLAGVPAAFADFAAGTTGKLAVTIE